MQNSKLRRFACVAIIGIASTAFVAKGNVMLENKSFRLEFDVKGKPKSLLRLADGKELLRTVDPGRGFFLEGLNLRQIPLADLSFDGRALVARNGFAKLTFAVNVQDTYMAFALERVEGVPAANLLTLQFEMNVVDNIAMHPLDHMTYKRNCYGATDGRRYDENPLDAKEGWVSRRVFWNWLWDRHPDNPFGAFALQCPRTNAEHDETLLEIWANEDALPKPAIEDDWTVARARQWLDGWLEFSRDIRSITIDGKNAAELRELVDFAEKEGLNQIKLFTHTWRGGFWPYQRHHLIPNPEVFPGGEAEFKEFCDYVANKGMRLELHTLSMCIANVDPYWVKTPDGPDSRLAHWVKGELAEPFVKDDGIMLFRPEPGATLPTIAPRHGPPGPRSFPGCFRFGVISVGKEFFHVDQFMDTDREIWRLKIGQRGLYESEQVDHAEGERMVGYIRPYGQVFTADNNSTLLDELARGYGEFCNTNHVTMISLDGLEVHLQDGYGEPKFGRLLYQYLDHYTTSGSSTGGVMPFHMEYWFKAARNGTTSCVTMPLALERTGRRATNPYEVHVEVARFVAQYDSAVGGLMKPEPMFDLSKEMLETHGLSDRFIKQLRLWREVSENLTDNQRQTIDKSYRSMARNKLGIGGSHHKESDIIYEPREIDGRLCLMPLSLLGRPGIDAGWGTGQEFGPICVWQFVKVGERVSVQNRFEAQEPEFVIHVMSALTNRRPAGEALKTGEVDRDREGYDIGAGLDQSLTVEGAAKDLYLQPKPGQVKNRGDYVFGQADGGLRLSYSNPKNEPYTEYGNVPYWEVKANSDKARGLGLTVTGDGSGALLLIRLQGRGACEYIVPLDFTGPRDIVIPTSTASWTDLRWFWKMDVKNMQHEEPIGLVSLGFGHVPPKTAATAVVSNLRLLAETPAALVNPTVKINDGELQIQGEVKSDHYIWFTGGDTLGVYDLNWNEVARLPVTKKDFVAPGKGSQVEYQILSEGEEPFPYLGVEIFTAGEPMLIESQ